MCGIIGYIGKQNALPILLSGLKRLEYRGYDSYGVCIFKSGEEPFLYKKVGKVSEAQELSQLSVQGHIGQAHTRWATTGLVTEENAHPHFDCKKEIFVVHNGIIENYQVLKEKLIQEGHRFTSETDTEVIPHLIEHFLEQDVESAVRKALRLVRGTYGLLIICKKDPEKLIAARLSSPLVVSLGDEEGFVASDPSALLSYSNKIIFLGDGEIATVTRGAISVTDLASNPIEKEMVELEWSVEEAKKGGYPHFLLKEIMEQSESMRNALRGRLMLQEGMARLGGLEAMEGKLREIEKVHLLACGTASYASKVGEYMLEEYAGIPCEVDIGSEFRYRKPIIDKKTLFVFVSQSGETADTLAALQEVKKKGGLTLGIVNVVGSAVAREVDAGIYTHAGPEIAVASTKAFTAQLAVLALLALFLGRQRQLSLVMGSRIAKELSRIPELIEHTLRNASQVQEIAQAYKDFSKFWLIGRKYNYPIALEGALKLKETTRLHAEGSAAGELKHGSLAVIGEDFPTIAIAPSDSVYEKTRANIQEIKVRKGPVIAIATEGNQEIKNFVDNVVYIPKTLEMLTPILSVIPLQLFAYYSGVLRGCDVDRPANIAKTVTVE